MAIDMTTVKKIVKPGNIYVKRIFLTNNSVVYKDNTSVPCPVKITLFSKTTDIPQITANNLYDVLGECGYTQHNTRYYLTVDNPYEFIYNNGTYDCVYASLQIRGINSIYIWFSVPGAISTGVSSG